MTKPTALRTGNEYSYMKRCFTNSDPVWDLPRRISGSTPFLKMKVWQFPGSAIASDFDEHRYHPKARKTHKFSIGIYRTALTPAAVLALACPFLMAEPGLSPARADVVYSSPGNSLHFTERTAIDTFKTGLVSIQERKELVNLGADGKKGANLDPVANDCVLFSIQTTFKVNLDQHPVVDNNTESSCASLVLPDEAISLEASALPPCWIAHQNQSAIATVPEALTCAGVVFGGGTLGKTGLGAQKLPRTNTFTGGTLRTIDILGPAVGSNNDFPLQITGTDVNEDDGSVADDKTTPSWGKVLVNSGVCRGGGTVCTPSMSSGAPLALGKSVGASIIGSRTAIGRDRILRGEVNSHHDADLPALDGKVTINERATGQIWGWKGTDSVIHLAEIDLQTAGSPADLETNSHDDWRGGLFVDYSITDPAVRGCDSCRDAFTFARSVSDGHQIEEFDFLLSAISARRYIPIRQGETVSNASDDTTKQYGPGTFQAIGQVGSANSNDFASTPPFSGLAVLNQDISDLIEVNGAAALLAESSSPARGVVSHSEWFDWEPLAFPEGLAGFAAGTVLLNGRFDWPTEFGSFKLSQIMRPHPKSSTAMPDTFVGKDSGLLDFDLTYEIGGKRFSIGDIRDIGNVLRNERVNMANFFRF